MSFSVDSFMSKLSALNETQDSIVSVSQWIQFHRRACGPIAQTWYDYIRNIPLKRKLAMIYLANDVVQQAKAKKRDEFIEAFSTVIVDGIVSTYREGNNDLRNKIKRVVEVWEQRQVFRPDVIEEINSKTKQLDSSESTTGTEAIGGSSIGGTGLGGIGGSGLGGLGGIGGSGLGGIGGSGLGGIGGSGLGGIGGSGFGDLGSSSTAPTSRPELQELNTLLGKVTKTTTVTETKSKLESSQKSRDSQALASLLETVNKTITDIAANQKLRSEIDAALLNLKNKQASLLEEDKHSMTMFEKMKKEILDAQKEVSSLVQDTNGGSVEPTQPEEEDNDDYVPQPASEPAPSESEPTKLPFTVSEEEDDSDSYEPLPAVETGGENDYKPQPLPSNDFSVPQYDSDSDSDGDSDAPEAKKRKVGDEE
ncbi:UPF0400 protein [Yarrowia sp. C11]|nr:UPF0400 protein [Yarrowia sp. C11]KAG5371180.1 UPF0400 protein [Yarrowia sp. E02]